MSGKPGKPASDTWSLWRHWLLAGFIIPAINTGAWSLYYNTKPWPAVMGINLPVGVALLSLEMTCLTRLWLRCQGWSLLHAALTLLTLLTMTLVFVELFGPGHSLTVPRTYQAGFYEPVISAQ